MSGKHKGLYNTSFKKKKKKKKKKKIEKEKKKRADLTGLTLSAKNFGGILFR